MAVWSWRPVRRFRHHRRPGRARPRPRCPRAAAGHGRGRPLRTRLVVRWRRAPWGVP